jgi:hypothetical protein
VKYQQCALLCSLLCDRLSRKQRKSRFVDPPWSAVTNEICPASLYAELYRKTTLVQKIALLRHHSLPLAERALSKPRLSCMEVVVLTRPICILVGYDKNPASKYLSIGLFQIKESLSHLLSIRHRMNLLGIWSMASVKWILLSLLFAELRPGVSREKMSKLRRRTLLKRNRIHRPPNHLVSVSCGIDCRTVLLRPKIAKLLQTNSMSRSFEVTNLNASS